MNWVEYKGCIAQVTTCPGEEQRVTSGWRWGWLSQKYRTDLLQEAKAQLGTPKYKATPTIPSLKWQSLLDLPPVLHDHGTNKKTTHVEGLFSFEPGSLSTYSSCFSARLVVSQLHWSSCLVFTVLGHRLVREHTQHVTWMLGSELRSSWLFISRSSASDLCCYHM